MADETILVIRHGALGDIVLSTGPFAAIRRHHPAAHIILLTTRPYAALLQASPYFDEVWIDERADWRNVRALWRLIQQLNKHSFSRVYDLQTSRRSSFYYSLIRYKPDWSGFVETSALFHGNPQRKLLHTLDRQRDQLATAGITDVPPPDVSWLKADLSKFALPPFFALIVPGGSAHRPEKRWPAEHYDALCGWLIERGIAPVLLGGEAEKEIVEMLGKRLGVISLAGRTDFADLAELGRLARFAIGNDTGPMHLIAASGCLSVVLFSHASDPALCAPRGGHVTILRSERLYGLSLKDVKAQLGLFKIGGRMKEIDVFILPRSISATLIREQTEVILSAGTMVTVVLVHGDPEAPDAYEIEAYLPKEDTYALATIEAKLVEEAAVLDS